MSSTDSVVPVKCRLLYLVGQLSLGGLEHQLFYLIRSMDRVSYKPIVVVWGNSPDDHYAQDLSNLDVPVIRLGACRTPWAKLKALCRLMSTLRPEVVHSYTFYTNMVAWWVTHSTRAIPIGSVRNNFIRDRRATGKVFGRLCGRWPSAQIFNSSIAKENAQRVAPLFRPRRIYVVKNGVDLNHFSPQPHPDVGYVLAVGSMFPRKRWDRLIRAVACVAARGVRLEVVHAGSGPLREELEALASTLHVRHVFRFLGARHDIQELLAGAAFLVHTAEEEGCPNVVMEAMACGRAVVATDAGDVPYLIEHGKTGFIVPREDEAALTRNMTALLDDREWCRRMGEAGRVRAEQAFGIDRLRCETFAVYRAEGWKDS